MDPLPCAGLASGCASFFSHSSLPFWFPGPWLSFQSSFHTPGQVTLYLDVQPTELDNKGKGGTEKLFAFT